jgi:hypothetical protein
LLSLGDRIKEDDQMIIILHAVQFWGAHVAISRSVVGGKYYFVFFSFRNVAYCHILLTYPFISLSLLFSQPIWSLVMANFFLHNKLLSCFKM